MIFALLGKNRIITSRKSFFWQGGFVKKAEEPPEARIQRKRPGNASKDSTAHAADRSGSEGRLTTLAIGQNTKLVLARPFAKQPFLAIGGLTQRSGSARVIDIPVLGLQESKKREFEALSADLRDDVRNRVALGDFRARECCRDSGIWFPLFEVLSPSLFRLTGLETLL